MAQPQMQTTIGEAVSRPATWVNTNLSEELIRSGGAELFRRLHALELTARGTLGIVSTRALLSRIAGSIALAVADRRVTAGKQQAAPLVNNKSRW